ncbi:hypothetical protein D3C87_1375910 [compost metagenome]
MYRFQVGDKVRHIENSVEGVITKQLTFDEESGEPVDEIDPNCPWYNIVWVTDNGDYDGFEHDESVELSE